MQALSGMIEPHVHANLHMSLHANDRKTYLDVVHGLFLLVFFALHRNLLVLVLAFAPTLLLLLWKKQTMRKMKDTSDLTSYNLHDSALNTY